MPRGRQGPAAAPGQTAGRRGTPGCCCPAGCPGCPRSCGSLPARVQQHGVSLLWHKHWVELGALPSRPLLLWRVAAAAHAHAGTGQPCTPLSAQLGCSPGIVPATGGRWRPPPAIPSKQKTRQANQRGSMAHAPGSAAGCPQVDAGREWQARCPWWVQQQQQLQTSWRVWRARTSAAESH